MEKFGMLKIVIPIILILLIMIKKDNFIPKHHFWEKQDWNCFDILMLVSCFSLFQLCYLVLFAYKIVPPYYLFIYGNFFCIIALGIILYGILHYKYDVKLAVLGLSFEKVFFNIMVGLLGSLLYVLFALSVLFLLYRENLIDSNIKSLVDFKFNQWPIADYFVYLSKTIVLSSFIEEIVYRGFMYGPFQKKLGVFGSVCTTSGIWVLAHSEIESFFSLFLMGIFLCYIYKKTHSLIPGIIMHSTFNLSSHLICVYITK